MKKEINQNVINNALINNNIKQIKGYLLSLNVKNTYGLPDNVLNKLYFKNLSVNNINHELMYICTYRENTDEIRNGLFISYDDFNFGHGLNEFVTDYYNCIIFKKSKLGYFDGFDFYLIKEISNIVSPSSLADAYFNSNVKALYNNIIDDEAIMAFNDLLKKIDSYYYIKCSNSLNKKELDEEKNSIRLCIINVKDKLNKDKTLKK